MNTSCLCIMIILLLFVLINFAVGTSVDERELDSSNYQYAREVDNELQLARILMLPQRICHTKRNSELINSILGLPKNMNNAGK
ncbi:pigment-dispersing hormone peptides [Aphidius gifuensis]|uniref:pigment-dispersing hormone peptides n=1 Tax=Aphidius gifuensis TaxID=684658 RepID=UPI001CDB975A|nr:pigment-dispersing hormone peptides [Aphidius gifuensis]